jgi:hypothetical protein
MEVIKRLDEVFTWAKNKNHQKWNERRILFLHRLMSWF